MIDLIIKNLMEHKTRTFLTTLGIIIAITAIISLGSISEGIQNLAKNSVSMMGGLIVVSESSTSMSFGSNPASKIDIETKEEIENIEGVERVAPAIFKAFPGYTVRGIDLKDLDMFHFENLKLKEGELMKDGEYEVVVGSETAKIHNLEVNDVIKLGNNKFTVVGIFEKTDTIVDYATITSLKAAQKALDMENYFTILIVKPKNPDDVEIIKDEIERNYDNLQASTQKDLLKKAEESINNVRIFTLGIGIITAIVAAIGIFNTVSMSVSSRIKDFGIMKGIGAERKTIIYLVVGEGIIIAIIGGIIGILIGIFIVDGINTMIGSPIAKVTINLIIFGFMIGIILSVVSSLYPAITATKVDPIEAMKE